MPVDGRAFLKLTTNGGSCKCLRPELRPLALGITGETGGVAQDQPTHKIDVPVALTRPPADLVDNAVLSVDVERGKPLEVFRVLRNGIEKGAGMWTLYVRAEDGTPAPTTPPPAPGTGYEP
ncbi:hypothetical protein K7W42_20295 [Deinococcus sp. HMF7604]|uniref:hypothetical protein n=1 Tax=Deinococcus betulae TaxID=2873312 RepID=UPI001CCF6674|nr:hypothetical protein [Deinococcus betulae]MBZ9753180.1 hypothetical protein [Deinococcus betulae]